MVRLLFLSKQIRERSLQVAVTKIAVPHDTGRSVLVDSGGMRPPPSRSMDL